MNTIRKGIYLALAAAVISGISNFIMKLAVTNINDPYLFTTLKNVIVGLILAMAVLSPWAIKKMKGISKSDWLKLFFIGIIGGSVPFLLYFKGLSMTSPISASMVHKSLFIWVAILAVPFLKEKISAIQAGAFGLLILSNLMLVGTKALSFGAAEGLCLLATVIWAVENIIAKKILNNVDAKVVAFSRMFFGSIILTVFILLNGSYAQIADLSMINWAWISLSSIFLLGYVLAWYSALKNESAIVVSSILVLGSPLSTLLAMIFIEHSLSLKHLFASFFMALAVSMIYMFKPRRKEDYNFANVGEKA